MRQRRRAADHRPSSAAPGHCARRGHPGSRAGSGRATGSRSRCTRSDPRASARAPRCDRRSSPSRSSTASPSRLASGLGSPGASRAPPPPRRASARSAGRTGCTRRRCTRAVHLRPRACDGDRRRRRRSRSPQRARGCGRRSHRPPGEQREPARPEPAAEARLLSDRRAAARLRGERGRAACARAARSVAHAAGRGDLERDLRRRRRAVRGLGRLRLLEGRSRAALRDPRRRAPRPARLHGRPRRHAHADAPGGVPGRGHLRPATTRGERAWTARPDRELAAERPLPGARGGSLVSATAALPALEPCEQATALLVARRSDGSLTNTSFDRLGEHLRPGDLLVVNNSATLAAAIPARLGDEPVELRLSTPLEDGRWLVELRTADLRLLAPPPLPARVELPGGGVAELVARYLASRRLSVADLRLPEPLDRYLTSRGRPIRYPHSAGERPIADYQTVFALEPGSAEMPSAARPFTADLVAELVARGILLAPITLHAGVSSLEAGEEPYPA